jgi:hypothetical protein
MGIPTIIDIIGAMIMGGILILSLIHVQNNAVGGFYYYDNDSILQQNFVSIDSEIEYNFRKIGYCANPDNFPDPTKAMIAADSSDITFLYDINLNGTMDTVKYMLGPTSDLPYSQNPNDRILYKYVNGALTSSSGVGILTQFSLVYFNISNQQLSFPITNPSQVATIQITMTTQSPNKFRLNDKDTAVYPTAYWKQVRLASQNLSNR